MDDFASFVPGAGKKTDGDWIAEAQRVAAAYEGKSEGELVRAIYARAAEGKRNGTLTNEQIDAFYEQFAPMLDGAKRRRLKKLAEELKRS